LDRLGDGAVQSGMTSDSSAVTLGSWVTVQAGELQEAWRVVDPAEADAARRLISADYPLGRALLGHRAGEQVRVDSPGGRWPVTILAVE
jgi:transcription elongation factor GreA